MHLRDQHRLGDFFLGDVEAFSDLSMRRLTAELLEQSARSLSDAVESARAIERNAQDARLFRESLKNALANPPHSVRDELDSFRLVELVSGANEAKVALIDQVRERNSLVLIFFRHGDDKSEVRPDKFVQRLLIIRANPASERDFLLARDERIDTDVTKVLIQRSFVVLRFSIDRDRHCLMLLLTG